VIDPRAEHDDAVSVSAGALIGLRAAGENLTLPKTSLRARESGAYLSAYRGRGIEFEESRLYQPTDDARSIDWRVTARTGTTHTKLYREERQRPVSFCVDFRAGMYFATRGAFKSVVAARVTALLAWSSHHHGDRVGGLLFSEDNHRELRPQRGKAAVLRVIRQLVIFGRWTGPSAPPSKAVPLSSPLSRLRRGTRPGSLSFVISDFRLLDQDVERHLAQIARHSSVVLVAIYDPIEAELPPPGRYRITDGQRDLFLDSDGAETRELYHARFTDRQERLRGLCRRYGMSLIPLATDADLMASLRSHVLRRVTF
jgi:uncharacterized protein (DUF58 family)